MKNYWLSYNGEKISKEEKYAHLICGKCRYCKTCKICKCKK